MDIPSNILAERYASREMNAIWSPKRRIIIERELWVAILQAQKALGIAVDATVIEDYRRVIAQVDLHSIAQRETQLQHDLMARLQEFSALAGQEQIHLGLTSRDITENCEQLLILESLRLILRRAVDCLKLLIELVIRYRNTPLVARTHNMPAQPTTLGRRLAMRGEEYLIASNDLLALISGYQFRGIKGAVGTQSDLLELFEGDEQRVQQLEERVLQHLQRQGALCVSGQIYPRSLDLKVVHHLVQLAAAPASLALDIRLMSGTSLMGEGYAAGRVGSSAMPHKRNPAMCERISALGVVLKGYHTMLATLSGAQWYEGDVSCSVVRRVALPNMFLASEGLLNTLQQLLKGLVINEAGMQAELERYLPQLMSSRILMAAVRAGLGREQAHRILREELSATETPGTLRDVARHPLVRRLAARAEFPLGLQEIMQAITTPPLWGRAPTQIEQFVKQARNFIEQSSSPALPD